MGKEYIVNSKNEYITKLIVNERNDKIKELETTDIYNPIFDYIDVHDEEEPNLKNINYIIDDVVYDLTIINNSFSLLATDYKNLISNMNLRLDNINNEILIEKDRKESIDILCRKYSEFDTVISIEESDLSGNFTFKDKLIYAAVENVNPVALSVVDISGNGYEGNTYIYKNNKFLEDIIDTSDRDNLLDNSSDTVYEYSRLTANSSIKEIFGMINTDNIEATCFITVTSEDPFNYIMLNIDSKDTVITSFQISNNGVDFEETIDQVMEIGSDNNKYIISDYIPGKRIFTFEKSKYVKIGLKSNGTTNDVIAYNLTAIKNDSIIGTSNSSFEYKTTKNYYSDIQMNNFPATIIDNVNGYDYTLFFYKSKYIGYVNNKFTYEVIYGARLCGNSSEKLN